QAMAHPLNPAWHWLMAMIVSSIALELGQPGEALTMIDEALAVPQIDHDDRLRQNLLRQRAMALYEQGHLSEAITLALDVHRHLGDYYGDALSGVSAMQLALLLTLGNRLDEAATYITQARTTFHSIGALAPLASLQVIELAGHMARGQATRAAATVNGVLRRLDEAGGRAVDLRLRFILATILGEAGEYQRALMLTREIITEMEGRGYRLFLAVARLYAAYLANCTGDSALQEALLHAGWGLAEQDAQQFLPLLPGAALQYAAAAALRSGVAIDIVGQILVRQVADQGLQLFQELLNDQQPAVRERAVRLLGGIGAAAAYVPLRSMLKDRHAAVRSAAEEALSRIVYRPPYTLRIRTLGAFTIWRGEHEVRDRDWRSSKARQLFQLLLTERGRAIPRDRLLDILWPDMDPEAAANNLRVTMNRLSKALEPDRPEGAPPSYLQQQSDTYSLNTETDIQLDVVDFIAAIEAGQHADQLGQRQPTISALRRAVMLYGGMYLPDTMYEDWSVVERERLALMFNDAAIRLGGLLLEEGEAHEAIGLAWRVLEQDRANEESYRLLMRAHASLGERSTALRIYTRCVAILEEDLGVEPLAETTALYQALRDTSESDDSSSRSISR
ncbi:MAG TPA: BTAD domain-containing putative transcriptional regulator, partial [Roseiflexaceae bacterium]|nr:BTAD domain-containing putative transcriptional regulator [Roseiflexaceae bacterium]